jgi:hypothetical protein
MRSFMIFKRRFSDGRGAAAEHGFQAILPAHVAPRGAAMNCCRTIRSAATLTALIALAGAATLLLPGCGGGAPLAEAEADVPAAKTTARAAAAPERSAEPSDPGARTRQGRYLTREQAQAMARQLDDRLVPVQARCCGFETAELDVLIAFGMQAAANLPADAPFVVSGPDLRQAAAVANRLAELGAKQVWLVTR